MLKKSLKFGLLSASLLVGSAAAINANIPAMAEHFADIPLAQVEMLTTISSLFLMISVLSSSFVARRIGYKQTIMVGLGLAMVAGLTPLVVENFYIILFSRAMLGLGIGLFNSLLVSMINHFCDVDQRSQMYGFQSAFEGTGGIAITFIAGQLVKINWQAPFYAYLIAIPVFLIYWKLVPKVDNDAVLLANSHKKQSAGSTDSHWLPLLGNLVLLFVAAMLYMTYGIKIASLITTVGYGTASHASFVIIMLSLGGILAGVFFGRIIKLLGSYAATIGLAIVAGAMFTFATSHSLALTLAGGFLSGVGFKIFMPALIDKINKSSFSNKSLATSLLLVSFNLGAFVSPYGSLILLALAGKSGLPGLFLVDGIGFVILSAITAVIAVIKGRKISLVLNK